MAKTFWQAVLVTLIVELFFCIVVQSMAGTLYGIRIFGFDPLSLLLEGTALFVVAALTGAYCVRWKQLKQIEEKLDRLLKNVNLTAPE